VGDAEHLAVLRRAAPAPAPRRDVVGVHLVEIVNPALVRVASVRAQRAVALAPGPRRLRLLRVRRPLHLRLEHAHVQQLRIRLASEQILEDSPVVLYVVVGGQLLHVGGHLRRIVALAVVRLAGSGRANRPRQDSCL
jgi:hypothetical protein